MDLDGITVVDFTHLLPGPYATQLLADLGAEVIKVEPPGGDAAREFALGDGTPGSLFAVLNRGKDSLALDLKADRAAEVTARLFAEADVVLEQFRPGVAERLGIGEADVREHAPEAVYCSLSGYGQSGPGADRVGHDLNYVGEAGLLDLTREGPDEPPVIPGVPVADMAGGLVAATSILAALLSRELGTESGEYLDVALTDAALSVEQVLAASAFLGDPPRAGETVLTGGVPWYDVYRTADDRYLTVAALEPRFWEALCGAIDRPDLREAHGSEDPAVREATREALAATFAEAPIAAWESLLEDPELPVGRVRRAEEALTDPALADRGMVLEGAGEAPPRLGFPAAGRVDEPRTAAPALGADTGAVLERLGFDADARAALADAGVVAD